MRKLIMWNMITLDGFFEGPKPWEIDWHDYAWGDELEQFSLDQSKSIGVLLFGRITYEGMSNYWSTATGKTADFMNSIPKVVVSRTLKTAEWNNSKLISDDLIKEIAKLKQQNGKDIYIFGSANLSSTLMQHELIDEFRLGLTHVVLGSGNSLFKTLPERMRLKLVETRALKSGCVILRYLPETKT